MNWRATSSVAFYESSEELTYAQQTLYSRAHWLFRTRNGRQRCTRSGQFRAAPAAATGAGHAWTSRDESRSAVATFNQTARSFRRPAIADQAHPRFTIAADAAGLAGSIDTA